MIKSKFFKIFLAFAAVYVILTFSIPPDPAALERFGISALQSRLLSLTIVVPLILIWWAAFYGVVRLCHYVDLIKGSPDGEPLFRIAKGLTVLAISLPIGSILSALLNYIGRTSPDLLPKTVIVNNYISISMVLLAVVLISLGARDLVNLVNKKPRLFHRVLPLAFFSIVGTAYVVISLTNEYRVQPNPITGRATHYLPDLPFITTILIPYLVVWLLGFMAASWINYYSRTTKGVIYKKFLKLFATGLVAVIISSIAVQFFVRLSASLSLGPLLLIVYLLLALISAGYILIALGAKKLQKIEEV